MALAAQQADLTSGGPLSLERLLTFAPAPGSERALAPPSPKPRPSPLARASLWAQLPEAEPAQPWSPSTRLALADFLRGAAHQHGALSPTQALTRPKPWGEDAYQEGGAASSMWMAHAGQTSPICALGLSAGSTSSPGVSPCQPPEQIQDRTRASGCSTLPRVRLYLPVLRRR